jgi:hypothetical protein
MLRLSWSKFRSRLKTEERRGAPKAGESFNIDFDGVAKENFSTLLLPLYRVVRRHIHFNALFPAKKDVLPYILGLVVTWIYWHTHLALT